MNFKVARLIQYKIIQLLKRQRRALTAHGIALRIGVSWITAKKYLNVLMKKKLVTKKRLGKNVYWKLSHMGEVSQLIG